MAFDNSLADRVADSLTSKGVFFVEKKMFGGLCFMVDDKMCVGVLGDKLMARVGPNAYDAALKNEFAEEMAFTGKPMAGYVFVNPEGIISDVRLDHWVQLCINFNPLAKSSKKN